jgi:hypothetical protein
MKRLVDHHRLLAKGVLHCTRINNINTQQCISVLCLVLVVRAKYYAVIGLDSSKSNEATKQCFVRTS